MANLGQNNGIYHIRFRFQGKEYKKSLKTNDADSAAAAKSSVELTIHRLITGLIVLPTGIEPGDFILSGGTLRQSRKATRKQNLPSTNQLICEYLESQTKFLADSSHSTLAMHLRHLSRHLGDRAVAPCDRVAHRDPDGFQQTRLAERDAVSVDKERVSIRQLYKWAVTQGYLSISPAALLPPIKGGEDRPPFRTLDEIDRIIGRGGLTKEEVLELWECLYLSPPEIAELLAMIRANAKEDFTYLLHALPAYAGMQRQGRVVALLNRKDEEDSPKKYSLVSSTRYGGPGPGSPVHIPLRKPSDLTVVRISEGALKSDIATIRSDLLTIGLPSVGAWRWAGKVLQELGAKTGRLAIDADAWGNRTVAGALLSLSINLRSCGFAVELERWDSADGKGIDDLLVAEKTPEIVRGDAVTKSIEEIVAAAAKADPLPGRTIPQGKPFEAEDDPHRLAALLRQKSFFEFGK